MNPVSLPELRQYLQLAVIKWTGLVRRHACILYTQYVCQIPSIFGKSDLLKVKSIAQQKLSSIWFSWRVFRLQTNIKFYPVTKSANFELDEKKLQKAQSNLFWSNIVCWQKMQRNR